VDGKRRSSRPVRERLITTTLWAPRGRWLACALLVLAGAAVRLPLLGRFDLVSYDGTFYISQARALWSHGPPAGGFPLGYPLLISLFLPLAGEGVRAAQVVSLLAGLVAPCVLYLLAERFVSRRLAFYCALVFAASPLFVRLSLETFSESAYTLWMLLALLFYAQNRNLAAGAAGGLAAITRPEMVAIVGILALLRGRMPRRAAALLLPFLFVYAFNLAAMYRSSREINLLPKSEFFGISTRDWQDRERTVAGDTVTVTSTDPTRGKGGVARSLLASYARKLPVDGYLLARNLVFAPLLLALYGVFRRRTFLLAAFVPLFIGPLFTVRAGTERYLLPFLPLAILYAFVGAGALAKWGRKSTALVVIAACALAAPFVNWHHLTEPVDEGFQEMRTAGRFLHELVRPGDKVADRKPYVAFYADAEYVEIPHGAYDETMRALADEGVRFLSLHYEVIKGLRPLLAPLLTHGPAIAGELRFKQIYAVPAGLMIYERVRDDDPLRRTLLSAPARGRDAAPDWSPDGRRIAFASSRTGNADIYVIPAAGGEPALLVGGPSDDGQPDWSPDGTKLAFASTRDGDWDVYVAELASGAVVRVAGAPGRDTWPRWTPDGRAIVFSSERTGGPEIWEVELDTGALVRLTDDGDNSCPSYSPDGSHLAWTRRWRELVILDLTTKQRRVVESPREVDCAPAWSPDGRYLAVAAKDWGSVDIYIVSRNGRRRLLLTKNWNPDGRRSFDAFPTWSPEGGRLAIVSSLDGPMGIYVLEGLEAYIERLDKPLKFAQLEEEDLTEPRRSGEQ
jgi:TolB protein